MKDFKILKEQNPEALPREKCLKYGPEALTDSELLAILLRTGTKNRSVLSLSEELLSLNPQFDGLVGLMHFDITEYTAISGIGNTKAVELCAVGEIARRIWNRSKRVRHQSFSSAPEVMNYFKEELRYLSHEVIHILYLDHRMQLIRDVRISSGTCNQTAVSARDIFIRALHLNAVCMIMVHNHPSGSPLPSGEDIQFTKELSEAGRLIGVTLLDHVIIGDNRYYSFKEQEVI